MSVLWGSRSESVPSWVALVVLGVLFGLGVVGLTSKVADLMCEQTTGVDESQADFSKTDY